MYAIWSEPAWWYEGGDYVRIVETDASLLRCKRYCAAMGYEMLAYTDRLLTFDRIETFTAHDMTLVIRKMCEKLRKLWSEWNDGQ